MGGGGHWTGHKHKHRGHVALAGHANDDGHAFCVVHEGHEGYTDLTAHGHD